MRQLPPSVHYLQCGPLHPDSDLPHYLQLLWVQAARDESGSVDREHNVPGRPLIDPSQERFAIEKALMKEPAYELDIHRREVVLKSIKDVASHRGWHILAVHVRSNHVHVVVEADQTPERVLNDFKAYASRSLNVLEPNRRRWVRHGSTRYLWTHDEVSAAVAYVLYGQGESMAVYCGLSAC